MNLFYPNNFDISKFEKWNCEQEDILFQKSVRTLLDLGFELSPARIDFVRAHTIQMWRINACRYQGDGLQKIFEAKKLSEIEKLIAKIKTNEASLFGITSDFNDHGLRYRRVSYTSSSGYPIIGHWLENHERWYCFTFDAKDLDENNNHSKINGPHIHFYSHLNSKADRISKSDYEQSLIEGKKMKHWNPGHIKIKLEHEIPKFMKVTTP